MNRISRTILMHVCYMGIDGQTMIYLFGRRLLVIYRCESKDSRDGTDTLILSDSLHLFVNRLTMGNNMPTDTNIILILAVAYAVSLIIMYLTGE